MRCFREVLFGSHLVTDDVVHDDRDHSQRSPPCGAAGMRATFPPQSSSGRPCVRCVHARHRSNSTQEEVLRGEQKYTLNFRTIYCCNTISS